MKTSEIPLWNQWTCTDPDTQQYGRHIIGTLYQFYEGEEVPVYINTATYSHNQIEFIINGYGYTLGPSGKHKTNIHELYPVKSGSQSANWIIAECIFESEYASLKTVNHENANDKKAI